MTMLASSTVPKTVPKSHDLEKRRTKYRAVPNKTRERGQRPIHPPVVLSECGESKDSDSDGRNSQRKH